MRLKKLTCIKWIGGKQGKEELYTDRMLEHKIFVDCTFGGGSVTLYKQIVSPAPLMTVVNDKNDKLVNFLRCLQSRPDELYERCAALPWSESIYNQFKWEPEPKDELERAIRFFYIMRLTFSGGGHKYRNGLGLSKTFNKASQYRYAVELIHEMSRLIKDFTILSRDVEDVIRFFDTPDTLFFVDPPYVGMEDIYSGGFTKQDHGRLKCCLDNIKGKSMVCYYENPLIDEMYSGWHRYEYETSSQLMVNKEGVKRPVKKELILTNYKPPAQVEQLRLLETV